MNVTYKRVTQVAVVGAVSLLFGTGAEAGTAFTRWDPIFGGAENPSNLWWEGVATFSIPDGCLSGAPTGTGPTLVFDNGSGTDTCAMRLLSAEVTLYNDPPGVEGGTSVYNFGPQDFNSEGDGMWIKSVDGLNAVIGIQTEAYSFLDPAGVHVPIDANPVYNDHLWLWFTSPVGGEFDPANASTRPCGFGNFTSTPCDGLDSDYDSNPAPLSLLTTTYDDGRSRTVTAAVPEPGTMGLALGALGAGWFARRRKKTA